MTRRRRPRTSEERLVSAVGSVARGVVGGRVRNVRQAAPLERNTGPSAATSSGVTAATTYLLSMSSAKTYAANTPTLLVFDSIALIDEATASAGSTSSAPYSDSLVSFDGTNAEVTIHETGLWYWALVLTQSTSTNTTDSFKVYGNSPANTIGTQMALSKDPFGSSATSTIWGCDWVNSWFGSPSFTVWFNLTWAGAASIGNMNPQLYLARVT